MTRGDDGVYHASIDARTPADAAVGTIKVWMESGDGEPLALKPMKVVQRLSISHVEAAHHRARRMQSCRPISCQPESESGADDVWF